MSLTSCDDDNVNINIDKPLQIIAEVCDESPATRLSGTSFANGDKIGISGGSNVNVPYTYNNSEWSPSGSSYVSTNGEVKRYTAYYPYNSSSSSTISFDTRSQSSASTWENLYVAQGYSTITGLVKFSFTHYMSKLTLNITTSLSYTSYTISGAKSVGSLDMTSGTLNLTSNEDITKATTSKAITVYLLPQNVSSLTLSFSVNDKPYTTTLDIPDEKLKSGYNYIYPVTIK